MNLLNMNEFTTNFWKEKVVEDSKQPPHKVVITDKYEHYYIGDENSKSYFRGFAGAHVTITFKDGTVIKSSNLWYQGEIPEEFKNLFTPNAEIEWKWLKYKLKSINPLKINKYDKFNFMFSNCCNFRCISRICS